MARPCADSRVLAAASPLSSRRSATSPEYVGARLLTCTFSLAFSAPSTSCIAFTLAKLARSWRDTRVPMKTCRFCS
ncbi:hypothetical protein D3C71_1895160 [compost metagenome]